MISDIRVGSVHNEVSKQVPCIILLVFALLVSSGYTTQSDRIDISVAPDVSDSTQSPVAGEYQLPSFVAIQFGGSVASGDWFANAGGWRTIQMSARVQAFKRSYLGLAYVHQRLNTNSSYEDNYRFTWAIPTNDYSLHEIYGIVGIKLGPRDLRQTSYYCELGAGIAVTDGMPYVQSRQGVYSQRMTGATDFTARLAGGLIKPLGRNLGLTVELNSRLMGEWSGDSSATGALVGATMGVVFMTGL